ncbi:MAG: hypothetical protein HOA81_09605, partial [Opitutales bacterium]|nr:hypothetical protein [Opitutales bacterium]
MKRMISFVPLLAFFLCLTALANERPNVVIILADDMGYCDVGVYGCEDIETVNIDR